ncbi:hypothetical protein [Psychrosphaera algicola]|uniref:Uncharacterized protein n=1 Tax=Psychrosphaera algicola TaxID=3023714 RepID=A0ABT5FHP4_9GAMM|nr:hypothetical protein [Psychrosphaera sp. G1-22]MDC2890720.1 hypothetical protein [Psychrosphaera sp. G1-22]
MKPPPFYASLWQEKSFSKADVLSSTITPEVIKIDKKLYALCKDIETLNFINPVNIAAEKKNSLVAKQP